MERLKGKTAMVVGAGSIGPGWGNGKATAVTFAREGAQVFCVDRNGAAAEETVDIITSEGGKAAAFTADVSRAADVEAMVAACLKAYGRIDVLDNNVGIAEMGSVVEVSEASWDHVFAVNLKSAYLAMKHVIPVMERQGGGSIINISSIASIRHLGISYVTYATTKAAMNQMTRTTAVEFAPKHIRVNCDPARPDEDADGRAFGRAGGELRQGRCRGDVARARRAGADGAYGRCLGCRQRGAVSGLRRIEIRHRAGTGGRWRHYAEGELILISSSLRKQGPITPNVRGCRQLLNSIFKTRIHRRRDERNCAHAGVPAFAGTTIAMCVLLRSITAHCVRGRRRPAGDLQADPAPCVAAAAANDDDKIIAVCGALIDNEKTAKADRIKALIARAGAYDRKDQIDRAIGDYDTVLRLDPTLADIFNARGELWRKKGDRPRALADFGAAIKLNPDHAAAKSQLQIAGAGTGAARRADGGQQQAELQLRHRPARGREGDLRQSRIWPISTARSTRRTPRWSARPAATIRAPAAPCSASRTISSPGAMPASAGRTTTCKRR